MMTYARLSLVHAGQHVATRNVDDGNARLEIGPNSDARPQGINQEQDWGNFGGQLSGCSAQMTCFAKNSSNHAPLTGMRPVVNTQRPPAHHIHPWVDELDIVVLSLHACQSSNLRRDYMT